MKFIWEYFSKFEKLLWSLSVIFIVISFMIYDGQNYLTLTASLIGVTSLIFNAKGNPAGQALMIVFSGLYGFISWTFSYYGEMITYVGMTAPMSFLALISWIKNPYKGNKSEVAVGNLTPRSLCLSILLTLGVTTVFYYILDYFNTANLILSAISVATSFFAVSLTFLRSPYFAIAYASNDLVLIALWILATLENSSYISVVICFIVFLINDIYGFCNWQKIKKRQNK